MTKSVACSTAAICSDIVRGLEIEAVSQGNRSIRQWLCNNTADNRDNHAFVCVHLLAYVLECVYGYVWDLPATSGGSSQVDKHCWSDGSFEADIVIEETVYLMRGKCVEQGLC